MKNDPICSLKMTHINSSGFRKNELAMSCHNVPQKLSSKNSSKVPTLNSTTFRVSKATDLSPDAPNGMESTFSLREMLSVSRTSNSNRQLTPEDDTKVQLDSVNISRPAGKPVSAPVFVPRENLDFGSAAFSRKGVKTTETKAHSTTSKQLRDIRQPSFSPDRINNKLFTTASSSSCSSTSDSGCMDLSVAPRHADTARPDESNGTGITNLANKFERIVLLEQSDGLHNNKGKPFSSLTIGQHAMNT